MGKSLLSESGVPTAGGNADKSASMNSIGPEI